MNNKLFYGDNLEIMRKGLIPEESVDLIYIDPPFNSQRDYNIIYDGAVAQTEAFKDTWSLIGLQEIEDMIFKTDAQRYCSIQKVLKGFEVLLKHSNNSLYSYLVQMAVRIVELHRTLKETGSFYLHCDQYAVHYLKILCDAIFSENNFQNDIIWSYRRWTATSKRFQRMHDNILFYKKNKKIAFFNTQYEPYGNWIKKDYHYIDKKTGKRWRWHTVKGKRYKVYLEDINKGVKINDVWTIPVLGSTAKERLGYPTQKPEALLERIIEASCPPKGVVFDAYCGCGTTVAVAQKLKRQWIGIDITYVAIDLIKQRLIDHYYLDNNKNPSKAQYERALKKFEKENDVFGIPKDIESAKQLAMNTKGDRVRKEFEKWAVFSVGGIFSERKCADKGIDGRFYIYDIEDNKKGTTNTKRKECGIQVKSGKVGLKEIKEFNSTLNLFNYPIGMFITLEKPTKPMLEYINTLSEFKNKLGQSFNKIEIITIQNIFDEKLPSYVVRGTKKAKSLKDDEDNDKIKDLFDED